MCVIVDGSDPDVLPDTLVSAAYSVYIRVLGKPQGWAEMYSGFYDPATDSTWISLESIILKQTVEITDTDPYVTYVYRSSPPKFSDVTKQLLTIYMDMNLDGIPERYSVFDNALYTYFWDYDNNGLKHVQLRFYLIAWTA